MYAQPDASERSAGAPGGSNTDLDDLDLDDLDAELARVKALYHREKRRAEIARCAQLTGQRQQRPERSDDLVADLPQDAGVSACAYGRRDAGVNVALGNPATGGSASAGLPGRGVDRLAAGTPASAGAPGGSKANWVGAPGGSKSNKKSGMLHRFYERVVAPQRWAHTMLRGKYVHDPISFNQMNFTQYVAGEALILSSLPEGPEKQNRLDLQYRLASLSEVHHWDTVKAIYSCILTSVENGGMSWDSPKMDFHMAIQDCLAEARNRPREADSASDQSCSDEHDDSEGLSPKGQRRGSDKDYSQNAWCWDYNFGVCDEEAPHLDFIRGQQVVAEHFCKKCWYADNVKIDHPATAQGCPNHF